MCDTLGMGFGQHAVRIARDHARVKCFGRYSAAYFETTRSNGSRLEQVSDLTNMRTGYDARLSNSVKAGPGGEPVNHTLRRIGIRQWASARPGHPG